MCCIKQKSKRNWYRCICPKLVLYLAPSYIYTTLQYWSFNCFALGKIVITSTSQSDEQLRERLLGLTRTDRDYWSFKGNSSREHSHGLFQYPAMMVPQVARAVMEQACLVHPEIERVGDPFAGSGTILTESLLRGLSFSGTDINPLAVLLCRVKAGPFFIDALAEKVPQVIARLEADMRNDVEVNFVNRDKWFRPDVQIALSKIRRAILRENSLWARRFFWIGLAEAVRFTSNSRTSTYKLHVRLEDQIKARSCDAAGIFKKAITRNLQHMRDQAEHLDKEGYLNRGRYSMRVDVTLGDTRRVEQSGLSDIVLTSPSYGDNATTVPYGQYSYLSLQWMELSDIDPAANAEYLCSTHEIDARSLGGSRRIKKAECDALADRSAALKCYLGRLKDQPADRANRVAAFFRDLDACLNPMLNGLRPGGLLVWILGNRKVGGERMPLDSILSDLLATHQATLLCELTRRISSKKMASKNNIADTMTSEAILVMRKAV